MIIMKIKHFRVFVLAGILWLSLMPRVWPEDIPPKQGADLIQKNCIRCHGPERILQLRYPEKWRVIINRMQSKIGADISIDDADVIKKYLAGNYAVDRGKPFNQLCVQCHVFINKKEDLSLKKTKTGWELSVLRMRKMFPFLIGNDAAAEIVDYWSDPMNNPNVQVKETKADRQRYLFENKCMRCHTYSFIESRCLSRQEWNRVLDKKAVKYSAWISPEEIKEIREYIFSESKFLAR